MAVIPQFMPGAGAGREVQSAMATLEGSRSMMDRQQDRRREVELRRRQDEDYEMMKPIKQAQAVALQKEAEQKYLGAIETENAKAMANAKIPEMRAKWNEIMMLADPNQRANEAMTFVGNFGQFENIKEFEGEVGTYKEIAAKMYAEAMAMDRLQEQQAALTERSRETQAAITDRAGATGLSKEERWSARLQTARETGDQEAAALYTGLLKKAATVRSPAQQIQEILADIEAAENDPNPDPEEIAALRALLRKQTTPTGGFMFTPPGAAAPASTPAPAAAAEFKIIAR